MNLRSKLFSLNVGFRIMQNNNLSAPMEKGFRKTSLPAKTTSHKDSTFNALKELKENFKRKLSLSTHTNQIYDPILKSEESIHYAKMPTGIIYEDRMMNHYCYWQNKHIETPKRQSCIRQRFEEQKVFDKLKKINAKFASKEDILSVHSESLYSLLENSPSLTDEQLKNLSSQYDDVYLNKDSFNAALMAAGCCIEMVKEVLEKRVQNGFAIVRPPGHHASVNEFNGFCLFNNVAIATMFAKEYVDRILIVDWDVHHGQGTQNIFYDDPNVLVFSSHRYEDGKFWPNRRDGNVDFCGTGDGEGFHFNLPLETGMKNEDFLAYFHNVLLPVAYEFSPEIILISCGFDAAMGCEEGMMLLTPEIFGHLTSMLMPLANGKIVAVLEGGYCLDSLAESALHTVNALMGNSTPLIVDKIESACDSMYDAILNLIYHQRPYWKSLQYHPIYDSHGRRSDRLNQCSQFVPKNLHKNLNFCSDDCAVVLEYTDEQRSKLSQELKRLKNETRFNVAENKLCIAYDKEMEEHYNFFDEAHPECPQRTNEIMKRLKYFGVLDRALILKSRSAKNEELLLCHDKKLLEIVRSTASMSDFERCKLESDFDSIYFHSKTSDASKLAVGNLLQVVDSVCSGESASGIAVIRPPGHHAEVDRPFGFCFFNNISIAAAYAKQKFNLKKILIVDWDIHHGNGTQNIFENSSDVLFISIHLYKDGTFFPCSADANFDRVGKGAGVGFNVNVPWSRNRMGDGDYMSAFHRVVLPIAYQFAPELVLVSAGFDAAVNDPLGGCCVTPECFGHMTSLLSALANGKIILALEGGYNLGSISHSMVQCSKALLGDPLPRLEAGLAPSESAVHDINNVINVHKTYWPCLKFQVLMPRLELNSSPQNRKFSTGVSKNIPSALHAQLSDASKYDINFILNCSNLNTNDDTAEESGSEHSLAQSFDCEKELISSSKNCGQDTENENLFDEMLGVMLKLNLNDNALMNAKIESNNESKTGAISKKANQEINNLKTERSNDEICSIFKSAEVKPRENHVASESKPHENNIAESKTFDLNGVDESKVCKNHVEIDRQNDSQDDADSALGAVGGVKMKSDVTIAELLACNNEMFAVEPLPWCYHLKEVHPVPHAIEVLNSKCSKCGSQEENWICLVCFDIFCGRYVEGDMIHHNKTASHNMVLSFSDLSVWCYACDSYVHNEVLFEAKDSAYKSKFGADG